MLQRLFAALLVFIACTGCALADERPAELDEARYLTVDGLRPGMEGYGLTVFQGVEPERFDVKIIGVMRNIWDIDRDIILVECSGMNLEHTGIAGGMSGSPIYIDDKLIGALAYGFVYAKTAIAGVTPIAEMMPLAEKPDEVQEQPARGGPVELDAPLVVHDREFDKLMVAARPRSEPDPGDTLELAPIATPLRVSGLGPPSVARRWLAQFAEDLAPTGLVPIQGGQAGDIDMEGVEAKLVPGATFAARLLWGDLNWDAIGTVTEVVGDRVIGLGHPMLGQHDIRMPMTTGYVFTFMPSFRRTFKLGSGLEAVGVIDADRPTGVAGTKGNVAESVKLSVEVAGLEPGEEKKTYNFETIRHPAITAQMIGMAVASCMTRPGAPPEQLTARFRVTARFDDREPLVVENVASGRDGMVALNGVFRTVRGLLGTITDNEFERLFPESVDVEINFERERRFAYIESFSVDRTTVRRGETLRATVELRHVQGERQRRTIEVPIPAEVPLGRAIVQVSDSEVAFEMARQDSPGRFQPETIDQLIALLEEPYRGDRIYVRMSHAGAGVSIAGQDLPDLPQSVLGTIAADGQSGVKFVYSTKVHTIPSDVVVRGSHTVEINIEEPR